MKKYWLPTVILSLFTCFLLALTVSGQDTLPHQPDFLAIQWERERKILEAYDKGTYTLDKPFVVINPYDNAPLSALILFSSQEKAWVRLWVGEELAQDFPSKNLFHQIPVVGLGKDTPVILELFYDDGTTEKTTLSLTAHDLPQDFVNSTETGFSAPLYPQYNDENGQVLWALNWTSTGVFHRLSNGNLALGTHNGLGFYEMDLLGKVYQVYYGDNLLGSSFAELSSGDFLLSSAQISGGGNRLVELDRDTGEITLDWDLDLMFQEQLSAHFTLLDFSYEESQQALTLYGQEQTAQISYPAGQLQWLDYLPLPTDPTDSLYPDFWEGELLTIQGQNMAYNQREVQQQEANFTPWEGMMGEESPDFWGEFSLYTNENRQTLDIFGDYPPDVTDFYLLLWGEDLWAMPIDLQGEENFSLALGYEDLSQALPLGEYALYFWWNTYEGSHYYNTTYHYDLRQHRQYIHQDDLLLSQSQRAQEIAHLIAQGRQEILLTEEAEENSPQTEETALPSWAYTLAEPLVILDPYHSAPLTALLALTTEERGSMEITIQPKTSQDEALRQKFSTITQDHVLPIYGLYPDHDNVLSLTFTNELGESQTQDIIITTDPLPSYLQEGELLLGDNLTTKIPPNEEMSTVLGGFAPEEILTTPQEINWDTAMIFVDGSSAYDHQGNIRWYTTNASDSPLFPLNNGNFLRFNSKPYGDSPYPLTAYDHEIYSGFYEMDLLGRVYQEYIFNGVCQQIVERSNGDFFLLGTSPQGADLLCHYDRETGTLLEQWQLSDYLEESQNSFSATIENHYQSQTAEVTLHQNASAWEIQEDWFHLSDLILDDNLLYLSGKYQNTVLCFDWQNGELLWENTLGSLGSPLSLSPTGENLFLLASDQETTTISLYQEEQWLVQQEFSYGATHGSLDILENEVFFLYLAREDSAMIMASKEGENPFVLRLPTTGKSAQALPLYLTQGHKHNLSYESQRIGENTETPYITRALPQVAENLPITVDFAVDQGDRIACALNFPQNGYETQYVVLVGEEESRFYPVTGGETLYLHKAGLATGDYQLGAIARDTEGEEHYSLSPLYVFVDNQVPLPSDATVTREETTTAPQFWWLCTLPLAMLFWRKKKS